MSSRSPGTAVRMKKVNRELAALFVAEIEEGHRRCRGGKEARETREAVAQRQVRERDRDHTRSGARGVVARRAFVLLV